MSKPANPQPWFAHWFPLGEMHSGMASVHWKGRAAVAGSVAALGAGVSFDACLIDGGQFGRGVLAFIIFMFGAVLGLMRIINRRGDDVRFVADYKKGELRV